MKIRSTLMMLLPAILIVGLLFAGMSTWSDEGYSALGEDVEELLEELLEEVLEEEYFYGSSPAARLFSVLFEQERVAEQCRADALAFLIDDYSAVGLSGWMVPLRI